MKNILLCLLISIAVVLPQDAYAHSGRTDSSGGHNCNVGSCAGTYHYHNQGTSKSPSYTPPKVEVPKYTFPPVKKNTPIPTPQNLQVSQTSQVKNVAENNDFELGILFIGGLFIYGITKGIDKLRNMS